MAGATSFLDFPTHPLRHVVLVWLSTVPDISELLAPGMSHLPLVGALGALSAQVERAQGSRLTCMLIRLLVKKNEVVTVSCNWWELVTSDVAPCYRKLLQWEWFITD